MTAQAPPHGDRYRELADAFVAGVKHGEQYARPGVATALRIDVNEVRTQPPKE
jgi:hypothetical protein